MSREADSITKRKQIQHHHHDSYHIQPSRILLARAIFAAPCTFLWFAGPTLHQQCLGNRLSHSTTIQFECLILEKPPARHRHIRSHSHNRLVPPILSVLECPYKTWWRQVQRKIMGACYKIMYNGRSWFQKANGRMSIVVRSFHIMHESMNQWINRYMKTTRIVHSAIVPVIFQTRIVLTEKVFFDGEEILTNRQICLSRRRATRRVWMP